MRRLTGQAIQSIVLCWLAFIPAGLYAPRHVLFEILNSIIIGSAMGTGLMCAPALWETLQIKPREWAPSDVLILAVEGVSLSLAWVFAGLWFSRAANPYLLDANLIDAFGRWVLASSMTLAFIACGGVDGRLPSKSYQRGAYLAGFSVFTAFALMSLGLT